MKRSILTNRLLQGAGLTGLLLLAACGKQEAPSAPASASSNAAAPATVAIAASAPASPSSTSLVAAPASASSATATGTPANAPAPFAFDKLTLGDAVSESHEITRVADHFASNDKTLYASVATLGSSKGATLNATWRYLEGRGQLVSSISQSIATDGPAVTTFKVENPDLWPEGRYKVEIAIDGKPVASQGFKIDKK